MSTETARVSFSIIRAQIDSGRRIDRARNSFFPPCLGGEFFLVFLLGYPKAAACSQCGCTGDTRAQVYIL